MDVLMGLFLAVENSGVGITVKTSMDILITG